MADDLRLDLLRRLARYRARPSLSSNERESLSRIEVFVGEKPDCFERSNALGHVTASAWVMDHPGARVALVHHKKLGLWLQPGGHTDGDPDVLRVAESEVREETGLKDLELLTPDLFDVDVHAIPARPGEGAHFHYDVRFLFRVVGSQTLRASEESHDVRWVDRSSVSRYTQDPSVLRMLAKWPRA